MPGRMGLLFAIGDLKLPVGGDLAYLLGAMGQAVAKLEEYETGTLDLTVKDYTVVFSPN